MDDREDFVAFGFKAEQQYLDTNENEDEEEDRAIGGIKGRKLFRNFKMRLHSSKVYFKFQNLGLIVCIVDKNELVTVLRKSKMRKIHLGYSILPSHLWK